MTETALSGPCGELQHGVFIKGMILSLKKRTWMGEKRNIPPLL